MHNYQLFTDPLLVIHSRTMFLSKIKSYLKLKINYILKTYDTYVVYLLFYAF